MLNMESQSIASPRSGAASELDAILIGLIVFAVALRAGKGRPTLANVASWSWRELTLACGGCSF